MVVFSLVVLWVGVAYPGAALAEVTHVARSVNAPTRTFIPGIDECFAPGFTSFFSPSLPLFYHINVSFFVSVLPVFLPFFLCSFSFSFLVSRCPWSRVATILVVFWTPVPPNIISSCVRDPCRLLHRVLFMNSIVFFILLIVFGFVAVSFSHFCFFGYLQQY